MGRAVYDVACTFCHGEDGSGGHGGGPTLLTQKDAATVTQIVTAGRGDMPAFGTALSAEQIRDVSAFVIGGFDAAKREPATSRAGP